ncbi:MAG: AMP phosphorylase [Candidatus Micrarchaeota archaeon]|nr:AMP phosphorylase [Candidatus Micrarchaeota archaeon]
MKLVVRPVSLEVGGKAVVILNKRDAESMDLHSLDRVCVSRDGESVVAIVDITERFVSEGEVATNPEVTASLRLREGDSVEITPVAKPESIGFIKRKINGCRLSREEMKKIVEDVVSKRLSDIEISAFVTALHTVGISLDEAEYLSRAMIETGKTIKFDGTVVDKHSIGGIPGDKTSMILVPIIASSGLVIPKTSSRSITSPAGTADRMEVLAPVEHDIQEIKRIVGKTGGCLVWGGALDLAPADDAFIKIEHPLGIDPLLLPSILSKKKAVNSRYVVIDIPTGRGAKVKTIGSAQDLAENFIELGRRLGLNIKCAVTFGEQPLGFAMGPALEAREVLLTLDGNGPSDLVAKATGLANILFEMTGKKKLAEELLKKKASKKMRDIINAQGGDPEIKPDDIELGDKTARIKSATSGRVLWIKNQEIGAIAREAGAPKDKGAGILLHKKIGDKVRKGETLFTIYAENSIKLENAVSLVQEYEPFGIGKRLGEKMVLKTVPAARPHKRIFILER